MNTPEKRQPAFVRIMDYLIDQAEAGNLPIKIRPGWCEPAVLQAHELNRFHGQGDAEEIQRHINRMMLAAMAAEEN